MKQFSSGKPDYAFGQVIWTLRTKLGLTQARLAELLGISRRSVGEWEAGNSYPQTERLKHLIELAIKWQALPAEHEEKTIRALWQAAHQKILLDELWLSSLLKQQRSRPPLTHPLSREESTIRLPLKAQLVTASPLVDWGNALAIPSFYGREQELAQLSQWILQERCRVVSLLGMGGIGKSTLAVQVMHRLAEHFDAVIFRSLRDAPSCEEFLDSCLQELASQTLRGVPPSLEQRMEAAVGTAAHLAYAARAG